MIMKTLKLSILAILLVCSSSVFSNTPTSSRKKAEKQVVTSIHKALNRGYVTKNLKDDCCENFVLQFTINEENTVSEIKISGSNEALREKISELLENKKIKASSLLQGEVFQAKLHIERRANF